MKIIPAIDIINGKCVRLTKGDYRKVKEYYSDPLEVAQKFEAAGLDRLHVVDLDGAKSRHVVNIDVLKRITTGTKLHVDFGGGVKTHEDLELAFKAGALQVTAGSIAVSDRDRVADWLVHYGADRIILGADTLNGRIMVSGWQKEGGIDLFDLLGFYSERGISYVICTDISRDGALQGPAFELYQQIIRQFSDIRLIASGGVSSKEDLLKLKDLGIYGAIVGKAYYEGRVTLEELSEINAD